MDDDETTWTAQLTMPAAMREGIEQRLAAPAQPDSHEALQARLEQYRRQTGHGHQVPPEGSAGA